MDSPELTAVSPRPEPEADTSVEQLDHSVPADTTNDAMQPFQSNPTTFYTPEEKHEKGDTTDAETIGVPVPDSGRRAWLVVAGGFVDFAVAFGLLASFDVLRGAELPESTSIVDWVGRVQFMVLAISAIIIGPAFVRFGARRLMLSGTAFFLVSLISTSFAVNFVQYFVLQGFILSIGSALILYPAMGAISGWFDEKRALALGIAISGASLGLAVWPIIVQKLFRVIQERWTHRVIAVISVPLLLLSCLLVRERKGVAGLRC